MQAGQTTTTKAKTAGAFGLADESVHEVAHVAKLLLQTQKTTPHHQVKRVARVTDGGCAYFQLDTLFHEKNGDVRHEFLDNVARNEVARSLRECVGMCECVCVG